MTSDPTHILDTLIQEVDAGRPAALCVIVATRGSTPQSPGAMLCVDHATKITGTLGGGCVEAEVRRQAHQLLQENKSGLLTFDLDDDFGFDDGLICGGHMDVAICTLSEPAQTDALRQAAHQMRDGGQGDIPVRVQTADGSVVYRLCVQAQPKLLIAGGGHIGRVVAEMAVSLGFRVTVIDDRVEFANADRFPEPIEPIVGDIAETLDGWRIDPNTYIVIVTRGHRHDEQALAAVAGSSARYIGMIGSRRKIKVIYDDLKHAGVPQEQLDRVDAPIGLDIGAVTPEEIGVSIAAELIAVRRTDDRVRVEGPIPAMQNDG